MTSEIAVRIPDNAEGLQVLKQVDNLVEKLAAAESNLEHGYAKLGYLLTEVSDNGYWRGQYESFGKYIALLGEKFSKGRTQLYNYFSTVRELKDHVSESQLTEMGITKASELRRAVKNSGVGPSQEIISAAADPAVTVAEVRKLLFDAKQIPAEETEKSEWLDLEAAFYVTADEKLIIQEAIKLAERTDPIIQNNLKPSARIKEVILRFAIEYANSHGDE
jgi:hypothetical protein